MSNTRNADSPWNPGYSVAVSPREYELQVVEWLKNTGADLTQFNIEHLARLSGTGGEYEFDGIAEFTIFGGAQIVVIIECKRYYRPVEREVILSLSSKLLDVGAHKAMIFSTSGFQHGAIEYAAAHGIATITFVDGKSNYNTRSKNTQPIVPPPWIHFPKYSGWLLKYSERRLYSTLIEFCNLDPLKDWVNSDFTKMDLDI